MADLSRPRDIAGSDELAPWWRVAERDGGRVVEAGGAWIVMALRALEPGADSPPVDVRAIDIKAVTALDTAGAVELIRLRRAAGGCPIEGVDEARSDLIKLVERNARAAPPPPTRAPLLIDILSDVGESFARFLDRSARLLEYFGEVLVIIAKGLLRPRRIRLNATIVQMREVWIRALAIVAVLCFLIGIVVAYQGVEQLKQFGAETFTVEALGISILRELGVLLTAIIVAGRSGSAFAAQIGTMRVNQELDAMQAMGMSPVEWLVVPRIAALTLSMPLLVFWGNAMGLLGGAFACEIYLDFTVGQYFARLRDTVGINHFWVGMIKAPVFGFVIAAIGCYEGLQVKSDAESVGRQTTMAVVEAIFFVIVLDALFSIFFLSVGL
jgi:phospholipid/cholesterol/gamma-HCH transport system permease protein